MQSTGTRHFAVSELQGDTWRLCELRLPASLEPGHVRRYVCRRITPSPDCSVNCSLHMPAPISSLTASLQALPHLENLSLFMGLTGTLPAVWATSLPHLKVRCTPIYQRREQPVGAKCCNIMLL